MNRGGREIVTSSTGSADSAGPSSEGDATRVRLSVVIPVYNEQDTIGECLGLLIKQIEHIAEVVVVDNNSTDRSRKIVEDAMSGCPVITMIDETRQGLVYARNAGLDAATGDVIARIDADTRVPERWAQTIVEFFEHDAEKEWAALCGRGAAYGLPFEGWTSKWKARLRPVFDALPSRSTAAAPEDIAVRESPVLYGSNMVVRRETWAAIRDTVSMRRDVFEDVDMGLCVRDINGRNAFLTSITVGVSPRRMETGMLAFMEYMSFLPRTLLLHRRYGMAATVVLGYLPPLFAVHGARLVMIRAYDPQTASFSVRNFWRPTAQRCLP
ncbi:glycosyltransferase [Gordonia desulfuricans]|uniref:4,4'-diaponeurosporenoate glycosyltransferase n=1 Tax=Gordonia desulfuricans TaxID=89051 RepID=A0A7K3LVJ6_9ACTN|nr:glycosyltransferase [Gordonia desulfuricans]